MGLQLAAAPSRGAHSFASGPTPVALIELFTSEGCSSCPSAERWLAQLKDQSTLWQGVVPVSWHVTYWDRLGWRDGYASREFTDRQYAYAHTWRSRSVYTPCFVRNGREWHPGQPTATSTAPVGELLVTPQDDGRWRVTYAPPNPDSAASYSATLVVLGSGIVSDVRAGENRGRTLAHEFVVLHAVTVRLNADNDHGFTGAVALPAAKLPAAPRHALAAWVTRTGTLTPLQAAGGWLE